MTKLQTGHLYKVEVQRKILTIHESARGMGEDLSRLGQFSFSRSPQDLEEINEPWPVYW